ncbi:IclR family transcriptional regulator [Actinomadura violacea]|uniref:IclR family transcriptional regulator n=1 Tax=Actinomadura violacea TaxID=2819934 RepID=A0ABS3RL95_9ACTN|nr:IclR family transcriptional regulator [Actinomadura violacea]MBO2457514.1 IclR family transcriptional regulator [Actinomadura violacea]
MVSRNPTDEPPVQAVAHAFDVLELLAAGGPRMLGQIAAETGRSKATTHRLLATLVARGYAEQDARTGAYRPGLRCAELGMTVLAGLRLGDIARPHLEELNARTGEVVHLCVYDLGDVVYLAKLDSRLPVAPQSRVGARAPAHCVAPGRALLAHQPPDELARVAETGLRAYTEHTITDPDDLARELRRVRERGYAINESSWRPGVCGAGAVIRDYTGAPVAAVGCCVPESRFGADRRRELAAAVTAAAARISADLGHREAAAR